MSKFILCLNIDNIVNYYETLKTLYNRINTIIFHKYYIISTCKNKLNNFNILFTNFITIDNIKQIEIENDIKYIFYIDKDVNFNNSMNIDNYKYIDDYTKQNFNFLYIDNSEYKLSKYLINTKNIAIITDLNQLKNTLFETDKIINDYIKLIKDKQIIDINELKLNKIHILYRAHIESYYKRHMDLGNSIGQFLIDKDIYNNDIVRSNQLWYITVLNHNIDNEIININKQNFKVENSKTKYKDYKYYSLNPSMYLDNNELLLNIRHVNFDRIGHQYIAMSKDNIIKTRNILYNIKDKNINNIDLSCIESREIIKDSPNKGIVIGLEDLKIFKHHNNLCFVATSYEVCNTPKVVFGYIDQDSYKTTLIKPLVDDKITNKNRAEKNWMPILNSDIDDYILLVYSIFPFQILKLNTNNYKLTLYKKVLWNININGIRGSSCLISFKYNKQDGFLFVVHQVYFIHGKRHYIHRLCWVSKEYDKLYYSNPFLFEKEHNIEYANGIIYMLDHIYISYGIDDRGSKIMKIPIIHLDNMLTNITYQNYYK